MGRKGKELSIEVRNLIINSHKLDGNVSNLSRTLGIPRSTVRSVIKKFQRHSDVKNRTGRHIELSLLLVTMNKLCKLGDL